MIPAKETLDQIVKKLAEIMRIQDWDIELNLVNKFEMQDETECRTDVAACSRNRKLKTARIIINTDAEETETEWYETIIHEMYHIVTDDWHYHTHGLLDFVKDELTRENLDNTHNTYYERTIEILAKGFANAYPVSNFTGGFKPEVTD